MKNLTSSFIKYEYTNFFKCCLFLSSIFTASISAANENSTQQNHYTLDKTKQSQVISSIAQHLTQGYVFPEKGKAMAKKLINLEKSNYFKNITDTQAFSKALTEKLQLLSNDKHLQVEFNEEAMPLVEDPKLITIRKNHELEMWRAHNFGFEKIERLPFNIGYFHLSAFGPTKEVGPLIASAMNLLNNTNSLIIDLRGNFGGEEQTVALLASYFFDQRTHLLDMYKRKSDTTEQHWSSDYVEGARYASNKEVYLLVDNNSFSAAEDFSYTLKHLKRATLIGETTGGAANSGDFVQLTEHFSMFLPSGRGINPITKSNWEGKGVVPNISVTSETALKEAQKVILQKELANESSEGRKKRIEARISSL